MGEDPEPKALGRLDGTLGAPPRAAGRVDVVAASLPGGRPQAGPRASSPERLAARAQAAGHPQRRQAPPQRGNPQALMLLSSVQNHCCHEFLPASEKFTLIKCGRTMRQANPFPVRITHEPSSKSPDSISEGHENPATASRQPFLIFPSLPLPSPTVGLHAPPLGRPAKSFPGIHLFCDPMWACQTASREQGAPSLAHGPTQMTHSTQGSTAILLFDGRMSATPAGLYFHLDRGPALWVFSPSSQD